MCTCGIKLVTATPKCHVSKTKVKKSAVCFISRPLNNNTQPYNIAQKRPTVSPIREYHLKPLI